MQVNYFNLTNGLEFLEEIKDFKFVRIQSTLCEAKCWDKLILDLDYNFLIDLAQGNTVYVYDTSRNKKQSRAIYQGLEFIRYVLYRKWLNVQIEAYVKHNKVTDYFEIQYNSLSVAAKKKLDYVKKFLNTNEIKLQGYCKKSLHDGQYEYFKNILKKYKNY